MGLPVAGIPNGHSTLGAAFLVNCKMEPTHCAGGAIATLVICRYASPDLVSAECWRYLLRLEQVSLVQLHLRCIARPFLIAGGIGGVHFLMRDGYNRALETDVIQNDTSGDGRIFW